MDRDHRKADSEARYSLYSGLLHDKTKEYNVEPSYVFNIYKKGFMGVMVLACICSDGTALSPALIFQSAAEALQSSWAEEIDPEKHPVLISSSSSAWTLLRDRETRRKACSRYQLLLLDGHGFHLTMDFIKYCDQKKILLVVISPHEKETAFCSLRFFEETGRFRQEASSSDESLNSVLIGDDWLKPESIVHLTAKDLRTRSSILCRDIRGLQDALLVKKRQQKESSTLQPSKSQEYHGEAGFRSPKKVRQARDDDVTRQQQQAQQLQLQKDKRHHSKKQARLYKLQQAQEKRVERERLKEVREEKAKKVAEKECHKAARDAIKAVQLSQKGSCKASQAFTQNQKRQKRAVIDSSHVQAKVATSSDPAPSAHLGRNVKLLSLCQDRRGEL
ncbi:hypothetical protein T440DRAFT_503179 [Plenodomus tracheiphilus IPT5]|uniref:DDE-1 domain-containing protein n=1 Tax=Plenodomus tracheiphilus IPT5 TaxID=1408161 RepID=A0A6A7ANX6_9PLEO|nr:hypothetical protein T440DRAFT_503179 [Plenodomus tracheiphilus IPT5]